MISRKSIDEVTERARIEEVVGDFVNLKRRGSNMVGLCPFHHEKTPSFNVSPNRNIFKCFGCGKGGDSIKFVMEHEGYDYPEAIRYLAGKYGIQLEETQADAESIKAEKERESLYHVLEFAWKYFKDQLHKTEEGQIAGLAYFKERGFRTTTIEQFGLGYAPDKQDSFIQAAIKEGFSKELLMSAGLTTQHATDFFRHRVIFPIFNISGKVIAFAGRTLSSSLKGPKYLNSPETEIYNKRKVLYGLYQAKKSIRDQDNCFLVEGYTDVISLFQAGVENVVASSGTALTPDQVRLVRRYAARITVLYDSDPAGIKAAIRGLDMILEENLDLKLALLPEGDDPDSFIRKAGLSGFQEYIRNHGKDFILFKTNLLVKEAGQDPFQKATLVKEIVETLARIPEAIKRSAYITQCAHMMKIDETILVREINKAVDEFIRQKKLGIPRDIADAEKESRQQIFDREKKYSDAATVIDLPDFAEHYQERDIIRILLNYGDLPLPEPDPSPLSRFVLEGLEDIQDEFRHETYRKILVEYQQLLKKGQNPGATFFTNHPNREIQTLAIELLTFPFEYARWDDHDLPLQVQLHPDINYKKDALHAILRLKLKILMYKIEENQTEMIALQAAGQEEDVSIHLRIHHELLQMRDQITTQFKSVVLKV